MYLKLVTWLKSSVLSKMSIEAFHIILNETDESVNVMTSKSATNIKLFYRQRFFNTVIQELINNFLASTSEGITDYADNILN